MIVEDEGLNASVATGENALAILPDVARQLEASLELALNQKQRENGFESRLLANQLAEQHELLRVTLKSIGDGVITTDAEARVRWLNPVAEQLTGWTAAESSSLPLTKVLNLLQEDSRSPIDDPLQPTASRGALLLSRTGDEYIVENSAAPICDANGLQLGMVIVIRDVTRQRRLDATLRQSEALFNAFMDNSPALMFIKDRDGRMSYMNRVCQTTWDFDKIDWMGKSDAELWSPALASEFRKLDLRVLDNNLSEAGVDVVPLPGGGTLSLLSHKFPLQAPGGERLIGGISLDISDQKEAERVALLALADKEVLLKELHHRVKNNLQIICSLLQMQAQGIPDRAVASALEESRQRVFSIALVHERLYGATQMSHLDLGPYTRTLVQELMQAYSPSGRISALVHASTVLLDVNEAVPCGLIINELVTNAFKYAYPQDVQGEIHVQLTLSPAKAVRLMVSDNGVGLPPDFDLKTSPSTGMSIVEILASQLGGKFSMKSNAPGAMFIVEFPMQGSPMSSQ